MDVRNWSPQFWVQHEADCLEQLEKLWHNVPLLNANDVQNLTNQKLVRFRGMIQDMFNPEYYLEKYEVFNEETKETYLKCGKYLDVADCKDGEGINFESKNNVTAERQTLVVITTPAYNVWAENIETAENQIEFPKGSTSISGSQPKRKFDEECEAMETDNNELKCEASCSNLNVNATQSSPNKKICTDVEKSSTTDTKPVISQEYLLNFPIEGRSGKACHMKIYKNSDDLKLNELCEFVGFLSVDPILALNGIKNDEENFDNAMELETHNPSPALIPRIHCVSWKKLEHNNPLVKELSLNVEKMEDLRKELMIVLTQILLGDELAAEYLMYHLISEVYLRQELLVLGKFAVNISKIPISRIENYGEKLYQFIEMLMPKSHYLPMTLRNMNSLTFIPKKDYECNRLTSGLLQLSKNTHLVLDETKLTAGKLNEAGVKGVSTISNIVKNQTVSYDFNYYQMEYNCDIPILILSEGKSLLPCDCHIPLKPAEICIASFDELVESTKTYLIPSRLDDIRRYLTQTRLGKYEISENIQDLVQQEFVDMRQKDNITAEDLHQLLVLARLICLSQGKEKLNDECWKRACKLERERKARLANK